MQFVNFLIILLCFQIQLLQFHQSLVYADIYPECENVTAGGVFIESDRGCDWFIFCTGDDSFMDKCEEGLYFNQLYQTCDPKELVDCRFENTITTLASSTTITMIGTTSTTSFQTVASELPPSTALTPASTVVAGTTSTAAPTSASTSSLATTTTPAAIINQCPIFDNPYELVFIPHPKSCSDYFMCHHGQEIPMHCSAMLHFNVRTGKCDYPENVRCQADLSSIREQCQPHTTDFYPHPGNCNYYYFCKKGFLLLQQCPFFYGWDYERRSCVMIKHAKCYKNLQRQTNQIP